MAISSKAFGRVTLTGVDAKKFKSQVKNGRVKDAAIKTADNGRGLVMSLRETGSVTLTIRPKSR